MISFRQAQIEDLPKIIEIISADFVSTKRENIESVHIAPKMRGNGYGRIMMEYAIEFSKQNGAKLVQLTTDKQRTEAKKFYEKLGFVASHEGMKMVF